VWEGQAEVTAGKESRLLRCEPRCSNLSEVRMIMSVTKIRREEKCEGFILYHQRCLDLKWC
jgi:hypothetical protein